MSGVQAHRGEMWKHHEKTLLASQGEGPQEISTANTLIVDLQPPELWDYKFLLLKPPSRWYFVTAVQASNTGLGCAKALGCVGAMFEDWKGGRCSWWHSSTVDLVKSVPSPYNSSSLLVRQGSWTGWPSLRPLLGLRCYEFSALNPYNPRTLGNKWARWLFGDLSKHSFSLSFTEV